MEYSEMSNAEIRLKMQDFENEYEALKIKIKTELNRLEELDKEYLTAQSILIKRTRGKE